MCAFVFNFRAAIHNCIFARIAWSKMASGVPYGTFVYLYLQLGVKTQVVVDSAGGCMVIPVYCTCM